MKKLLPILLILQIFCIASFAQERTLKETTDWLKENLPGKSGEDDFANTTRGVEVRSISFSQCQVDLRLIFTFYFTKKPDTDDIHYQFDLSDLDPAHIEEGKSGASQQILLNTTDGKKKIGSMVVKPIIKEKF